MTNSRSRLSAFTFLAPYLRAHWARIALAALCLVLAVSITLVFPVVLRYLIDQALVTTNRTQVRFYFLLLAGLGVGLGLLSALRFYQMNILGERITMDIKSALYRHLIHQQPSFFEVHATGEVISRLTSDITLIESVMTSTLSIAIRHSLLSIMALAILIWMNPFLMLGFLGFLVLILLPVMLWGRSIRRRSRHNQDQLAKTTALACETLDAHLVVQSACAEDRESVRFTAASEEVFESAKQKSLARAGLIGFVIAATSVALLLGLYEGVQAVIAGHLSTGAFSQTLIYALLLSGSSSVLGEAYGDLVRAAGASERVAELFKLHTEHPAIYRDTQVLKSLSPGAHLELQQVSFTYPSRPTSQVIHDLSLNIKPGERVALVGPSGAGKTTLFQLLLRFYAPDQGQILMNGTELAAIDTHALRQVIAWVPQTPTLFSGTVFDNIRYACPDADFAAVQTAAKLAFAEEFIEKLPQGYDTHLGERGVRLSGGERQRIAIARAILKNAPLLLLDEATSSLDAHSETMVQAALEQAMVDRTSIVIAHRLATVQKADRILVLGEGRIVEEGTHLSLLQQGGLYAHLAQLQFLKSAANND